MTTLSTASVLEGFDWAQVIPAVDESAWAGWATLEPAVRGLSTEAVRELFEERDPAARDVQDAVLGALVRLGSAEDGDERAAAVAAAIMLPAAVGVTDELRRRGYDPAVAATALWVTVRTRRFGATCRMAASLRWQIRREALRLVRAEETLDSAVCLGLREDLPAPDAVAAADSVGPEAAARELWDLTEWARAKGVLTDDQVCLLRDLVDVESGVQTCRRVRPAWVVQAVADRRGWSYRTTRTRLRQAMDSLTDAVTTATAAA